MQSIKSIETFHWYFAHRRASWDQHSSFSGMFVLPPISPVPSLSPRILLEWRCLNLLTTVQFLFNRPFNPFSISIQSWFNPQFNFNSIPFQPYQFYRVSILFSFSIPVVNSIAFQSCFQPRFNSLFYSSSTVFHPASFSISSSIPLQSWNQFPFNQLSALFAITCLFILLWSVRVKFGAKARETCAG